MNLLETFGAEMAGQYSDALQTMANDCRDDPDLRARVEAEPREVFVDRGLPFPARSEIRVAQNTEDMFFLVMPPDPNAALSDAMLESTAGGSNPNRDNCASSISTIPSCLGTYSSATGA